MAGDSFDEAQAALEQQRRDYLAAMAQAGSQGAQEFSQAQADLNGQKSAAVQQALAEAARRGAPAGMQQSIEYQTSLPYNNRVSDLTSSNASRSASFGANKSAGDTVIAQAIANIPALRAMSQRQAEAERFKAQQQAQADQLSMALKQADMQIKMAELERARSGGGRAGTDPLLEQGRALENELKQGRIDAANFKSGGGDRSNWSNAGPKARSVLELIVRNNDDLGGALSDLYSGQQSNWADPADANKQLVNLGGTKLNSGALESWLRHYYGQA